MSARARQLAERCFALARSTTFAGEREAAIARGTVIATKARLSLDLFDIPGRVRRRPAFDRAAARREDAEQYERNTARPDRAPERYTSRDLRETMARFHATMAAQEAAAKTVDGETLYQARRRNFETATAAARQRDEALDGANDARP